MHANLIVFDDLPEHREARDRHETSIKAMRARLDRALALPPHMLRLPSDAQLRAELDARLVAAAHRVNADVARQLAALWAPPPYLSPAEREFLEGSHAGRH